MKTTIIIPCCNGASTIGRCLESVYGLKTSGELEVIVVDDSSTDDSVMTARRYPCRVVTSDVRGGAGHARNKGAELATGDFLFFTDADVVLPDNALELLEKGFDEQRADCVVGVFSSENPYQDFFSQYKSLYCNFKYQRLTGGSAFNTAVAGLPKRVFAVLNGFDETLTAAEDNEFGDRLFKKGFHCVIEHKLEVIHLKKFSLKSLLRNDFKKSLVLAEMFFRQIKRKTLNVQGGFSDISTSMMFNVPLVYMCLGSTIVFLSMPSMYAAFALAVLVVIYGWNNSKFFLFVLGKKGLPFTLRSFVFTVVDYLVVGFAVLFGARVLLGTRRSGKD